MDRPRRKRKPVDRYSPPPLPKRKKHPKPKPRYTLTQRARYHRRTKNDQYGVLYSPKNIHFWDKIQPKTPYQTELEAKVFGIDGVWRHIKSYIFWNPSYKKCSKMHDKNKPCEGHLYRCSNYRSSQNNVYYFEHVRWGRKCTGRFKEPKYTCSIHDLDKHMDKVNDYLWDDDVDFECTIS